MKSLKVSIVIPCWNSESQLRQNLSSVFDAASVVNAEIIVVDDASDKDGSIGYLKSLGKKITLYENESNMGFSYTVNRGVVQAHGDIVILLNTDVRPNIDCFTQALTHFRDKSVFAVTFNSDRGRAGGRWVDGLMQHMRIVESGNKNRDQYSLWASGGQAAFDRAKWLSLGGMDPMYKPFYWEDVDLGYRAWKRGWKIIWDPKCACIHDHKISVIQSHYSKEFIKNIAQRNQFLFVWKNISDSQMLRNHFSYIPRFIKNYPQAFFAALILLPQALHSRKIEKKQANLSDQEILSNWK